MLEHDAAGSAVTLPPPEVPVVVPLDSLPPPPQPAAANASATKMPKSVTALKPVLTLPPLSAVSDVRGFLIGGVSGLRGRLASETGESAARAEGTSESSYHGERAEVAELADAPDSKSGSLRGVWVRFPPSASTSAKSCPPTRTSGFGVGVRSPAVCR